MSQELIFACEGRALPIRLTDAYAPGTLADLMAWLPADITIHCAKIAGCHIYWPTPILRPLEQGADIHALPAGSFLYYPERQYMEITYDRLQAEEAAVNYLGTFEGDLGWLRAFAERQRKAHGKQVVTARLSAPDAPGCPAEASQGTDPPGAAGRLAEARRAVWAEQPAEIRAFLARDGLNIPFGPLVTAEGEFRRTQELMWRLWHNSSGHGDAARVTIARETLRLARSRVVGYCQLHEAGHVLDTGLAALEDGEAAVAEILGELTRYCGRMGAWLDLYIPWWGANELTRANLADIRANG